jgi:hypothetical protein
MSDLFGPIPITLGDLIKCAKSELAKRGAFYPRMVTLKRMTQKAADREIAMMREIVRFLESLHAMGMPLDATDLTAEAVFKKGPNP